jgi:predicted transcriptional regulator
MVKMATNYERVMKRFIPAFRVKAAKMMVTDYGVKQQHAAMMLGTTQAAISKYLKDTPNRFSDIRIESMPLKEFVDNVMAHDDKGAQKVMCTMCQSNKRFDCAFMVK